MPLQDALKNRRQAQGAGTGSGEAPVQRVNPEIDAKLNTYMQANQGLVQAYEKMDKGLLIRKLCLVRMNQDENRERYREGVREWVGNRPELKQQIEAKLQKVAPEERNKAFMGMAKKAMANEALKQG